MRKEERRGAFRLPIEPGAIASVVMNVHKPRGRILPARVDALCIRRDLNIRRPAALYDSIILKGQRTVPDDSVLQHKLRVDNCFHLFSLLNDRMSSSAFS
ncbi:hypothetical protein SDC9_134930 [bioreactor metagenome]|uniref:Uncharacterized protein n=1 Tax=bioreactor metagenome TaxID=1076179 RepID=A0A645DEE0_9ZZZZ